MAYTCYGHKICNSEISSQDINAVPHTNHHMVVLFRYGADYVHCESEQQAQIRFEQINVGSLFTEVKFIFTDTFESVYVMTYGSKQPKQHLLN